MREKLIELLYHAPCESELEGAPGSCPYRKNGQCGEVERMDYCATQHLADHLIANGVTVQEWISVKDRLPEEWKTVLVFKPSIDAIIPARLRGGSWYATWDTTRLEYVSHWMPLPQPPKGE